MAQAQTVKFSKQMILLGDGESPQIFRAPCGFETLTMSINVAKNDTNIPDCSNPDAIAWLVSETVSKQMILSGEGLLEAGSLKDWQDWAIEGEVGGEESEERMIRWFRDLDGENRGYLQVPAILSQYQEQGQRGARWRRSIELTGNGKPTWVPLGAGSTAS
jgi:hypothetical protein